MDTGLRLHPVHFDPAMVNGKPHPGAIQVSQRIQVRHPAEAHLY